MKLIIMTLIYDYGPRRSLSRCYNDGQKGHGSHVVKNHPLLYVSVSTITGTSSQFTSTVTETSATDENGVKVL